MNIVFYALVLICAWIYFGYPLLLWLLCRLLRVSRASATAPQESINEFPTVSIIIAARNEAGVIREKLRNTRELDYPKDRLDVWVASDGSTDGTATIACQSGEGLRLQVRHFPSGPGKSTVQNLVVAEACGKILVFTDAPTMLSPQTIKDIVRHFTDPRVGFVTGHVRYSNANRSSSAVGESLYWRYDGWIRARESDLGILAQGSGPLLAFQQDFFRPLDAWECDDFELPLRAIRGGKRVVLEDQPLAIDEVVESSSGLFRTKTRIVSHDYVVLWKHRELMNPFKHGLLAVGLISHKFLRWWTPLLMLLALLVSAVAFCEGSLGWGWMLVQGVFYLCAAAGCIIQGRSAAWARIVALPWNFCVVQAASANGLRLALTGRPKVAWEPQRTLRSSDEALV